MKKNIKSGDRLIWIVAVVLMLMSLVAIFSSTSSQAMRSGVSRTTIFMGQLAIVCVGLAILVIMSAIPNIKYIKGLSKLGFAVSTVLLLIVVGDVNLGPFFHAIRTNQATRAIYVCGLTLQVYEVVKIAMVMYLSWAMSTYEQGRFDYSQRLASRFPDICGWMRSLQAQRWIYIYIPMFTVVLLTFPGSTGSALMLAIVMGVTLLIGGLKWSHLAGLVAMGIAGIMLLIGVHVLSNGKFISRMQTAFNRVRVELPYPDKEIRKNQKESIEKGKLDPGKAYAPGSKEFNEYRNKNLQNKSAEIAFVEGGRRIVGKGPGKSTQKYIVPLIFEDYMFCLLMEEYGFLALVVTMLMYTILFARGVIIVEQCSNRYAKACVGGLVFLITFQAMFHILINCNVGILTGQTLPMISHGKSSFLCFTIAFGVILAISRMAYDKIQKESALAFQELEKETSRDELSSDLAAVENIDNEPENYN